MTRALSAARWGILGIALPGPIKDITGGNGDPGGAWHLPAVAQVNSGEV